MTSYPSWGRLTTTSGTEPVDYRRHVTDRQGHLSVRQRTVDGLHWRDGADPRTGGPARSVPSRTGCLVARGSPPGRPTTRPEFVRVARREQQTTPAPRCRMWQRSTAAVNRFPDGGAARIGADRCHPSRRGRPVELWQLVPGRRLTRPRRLGEKKNSGPRCQDGCGTSDPGRWPGSVAVVVAGPTAPTRPDPA